MATHAVSREALQPKNGENSRGIPTAPFVESIESYLKEESADDALVKFQEMLSKYKFMEMHLAQRRNALLQKIPELEENFKMVEFMQGSTGDFSTKFELGDTLYAKARIPKTDKVLLWLGANVMLEYSLDEAGILLSEKLATNKKQMSSVEEDLQFIKQQTTTIEVNMARIYNWEVKRKKEMETK